MKFYTSHNLITDCIISQYGEFRREINNKESERTTIFKNNKNEIVVYAMVSFNSLMSQNLNLLHEKVNQGSLIGDTIRLMGFEYTREIIVSCELCQVELPNTKWDKAYCTLSKIYAGRSGQEELYCDICELYNPAFEIPRMKIKNNDGIEQIKNILFSNKLSYREFII